MSEGNLSSESSSIINPFKGIKERLKHFPWQRSRFAKEGTSEKHLPLAKSLLENPPVLQSDHYETEVASIEGEMTELCKQLKEPIENGEYGLFIGDDTSGRIPTLALKGFANFISEAFGKKYVRTVFLQAGRYVPDQLLEDQFRERILPFVQQNHSKKVLLMTEYVLTGKSIQRLINIFQKNNVAIDIASLQIQRKPSGEIPFRDNIGFSSRVFEGKLDTGYATRSGSIRSELQPPKIYGKESLSGISKRVPVSGSFNPIYKAVPDSKPMVDAARRDIQRLISRIVTSVYYQ